MRGAWTRWSLAVVVAAALTAPAVARADTPDSWITTKAKIALLTSEGVHGTSINVDTVDGRVTLHGKVAAAEEKEKAEKAVRDVSGVKEVRNLLQVVPEERKTAANASDKELKDRAAKALKDDPTLKDSSITVESVNNGVVLLGGKAKTLDDHLRAVEDASSIPGVRRVASEVQSPDKLADDQIRREEHAQGTKDKAKSAARSVGDTASDAYITTATKMRLLADSRTPALDVNVDTSRGVVTLFGMVPTREAKAAAEEDARKVSGVKKVANELQVVSPAKQAEVKARDEDVQREVKKAIDSRPELSDASIKVDVKNGVARLSGTVPDENDRLSAAIAARSAPGVRAVEDDLQVSSR